MKNNSPGFTLIELMIVIAIIGILSTMALPSYQDRVIRAQIEEALNLAGFAKDSVEDFYQKTKKLPMNNDEIGLPLPEKIVGNYTTGLKITKGGVIDITLGNKCNKHIENKIISVLPAIVKDSPQVPVAWIAGYASIPDGMIIEGENKSTVLKRHLPMDCRY